MKLFTWHVPGTRDKDAEIKQLQQTIAEREADLLEARYYIKDLERGADADHTQIQELKRDIDFERSNYEGLQERYHEVKAELHEVKAELSRWQDQAPYQVRQEGTGIVAASCLTLKEASDRACRWEEDLSIWMRARDGTYREMAPQEVTEMLTAQKLREMAALRHEGGMGQERLEGRPERGPTGLERTAEEEALTAQKLRELSDRHEAETDYYGAANLDKHPWRDPAVLAEDLAREAAQDRDSAALEPEPPRQPTQPQRRRREQPQAPPPPVLARQAGMDRGLQR